MTTLGTATRMFASETRDPRDVFLDGLELPRGLERQVVVDGDHGYETNGEDTDRWPPLGRFE